MSKTPETNFEQLFTQIPPEKICDYGNIFTMVGKDFFVITAGNNEHFNAMVGSGGGFGMLFKKAMVFCICRQDRYTLELIEKEQTYTISFFPENFKNQMFLFASASGRDSNKMKETPLTGIQTPAGNMSFAESGLIIECKLTQVTIPQIDDFRSSEAKEYICDAYKDPCEYRKYVFGEITQAWEKK